MAVTEADRKENTKMLTLYMAIVIGVIGGYFISYACGIQATEDVAFFDALRAVFGRITSGQILMPLSVSSIFGFFLGGGFVGGVVYFLIYDKKRNSSIFGKKHPEGPTANYG